MSQRHRQSRSEVPGYGKVPKDERRLEHRRERQAAREALLADPDDAVPSTSHKAESPRGEKRGEGAAKIEAPRRRRFRHWKARFWKRRSTMRHERNEAFDRMNEE